MIELYSFPTPNGHKVSIALEELQIPYRIIPVNIARGEQFAPEFLAISPNNRIPAIVDTEPGDGNGPLSVFESGAILLYLAEKTGRLLPTAPRQRYEVIQWLMWQMAGLGPMLGQAHHFRNYAPEPIDYAIERYTQEAARLYRVLDKRLADRTFLADEYSVADIACFPWVSFHDHHGQALEDFPNVKRWHERIAARDEVQRGLEAGKELWGQPQEKSFDEEARKHLFGQRPTS